MIRALTVLAAAVTLTGCGAATSTPPLYTPPTTPPVYGPGAGTWTPSTTTPTTTPTSPTTLSVALVPGSFPSIDVGGAAAELLTACPLDIPQGETRDRCNAGVIARHAAVPPCLTEDQSAPPCAWDAWTRGNRAGHSFLVLAGGWRYDIVTGGSEWIG